MSDSKVLTRYADICPTCGAFNSIKIDRAFRPAPSGRVAYGYCRECNLRLTIREVVKKFSTK